MRRGAVVIVALLVVLVAALAALDKLPISAETREMVRKKLTAGFGLALAVAVALLAIPSLPWWIPAAVAGAVVVRSGAWSMAADILGLPGGPGGGGGSPRGDGLPDPCKVGPYVAGGVAYVCQG